MPKKISIKQQIKYIEGHLKKKGIEPDTVDVAALLDNELSYQENLKNVLEQAGASATGKIGSKETEILKNPSCLDAKELKNKITKHQKADQELQNLEADYKDAKTMCNCNTCSQMGIADPHGYIPDFGEEIIHDVTPNNPKIKEAMDKLLDMFKNERFDIVARAVFGVGKNMKPSDNWSFSNRLLMYLSGTEDARGYQQWQEVGRYVKKGSKSIYILAPLSKKAIKTVKEIDEATGQEVEKKISYDFIYGFKAVPVFGIEDTEGKPVIEDIIDLNIPFEIQPLIDDLGVNVKGVSFSRDGAYGYYNPIRKHVRVASPDIEVLLHELSHAVDDKMHHLKGGQHKDQEVIAEFSAATIGHLMGFKMKLGTMFDYIQHYSFVELLKQLNRVERVVSYFIEHTSQPKQAIAATIHDSGLVIQRTIPIDGKFKTQLNPTRGQPSAKIGNPEDIYAYVKSMQDYDREFAKVLYLDTKNQVTGIDVVSVGSLNAAIVHPREVFKGAILNNAASIIFVHNHPSGNPEPSREDVQLSQKLKETGKVVGIDVLDSLVVGKERYYSMKEEPPQGQKIFDPHKDKSWIDELLDNIL